MYKQNLIRIARECNTTIENLSPSLVKSEMEYFPIPESEAWRVLMMQNLLAIRSTELQLENILGQGFLQQSHFPIFGNEKSQPIPTSGIFF